MRGRIDLGLELQRDAKRTGALLQEPQHFHEPLHQRIFEACARLIRKNQLASPVTLRPHFQLDQAMKEIGGPDYLAELAKFTPTIINAADFGRMIIARNTEAPSTARMPTPETGLFEAPIRPAM